jgi:transcriptional regulator with XRE-family HTH domain
MNTTLNEWIANDPERERLFAQEQLIVAVAEHIWEKMEAHDVTKADVAAALGKSKAFITQVLNGTRNMTLRTLSDIAFALDAKVNVEFTPRRQVVAYGSALSFEAFERPESYQAWISGESKRLNVVSELPVAHNAADSEDARIEENVTLARRYEEAA